MNTVRRLVLRKGGKNISIQTYGFTGMDEWCLINSESTKFKNDYSGGPGKIMNIPVVHCSGVQQPFTKTDRYIGQSRASHWNGKNSCFLRFFLRVRDHSFRYQINLEEGVICNKPLFDRTVGLGRTL